jgi:hypothetical protein
MKLHMYIMHGSCYSIYSSHLCLYVSFLSMPGKGLVKFTPPFVSRKRLGKHVSAVKNTRNNTRNIEGMCLFIQVSLVGNNSVKTFPRQRIFVGGAVFYAISVVWNESRRLILPRTPFLFIIYLMMRYIVYISAYTASNGGMIRKEDIVASIPRKLPEGTVGSHENR